MRRFVRVSMAEFVWKQTYIAIRGVAYGSPFVL